MPSHPAPELRSARGQAIIKRAEPGRAVSLAAKHLWAGDQPGATQVWAVAGQSPAHPEVMPLVLWQNLLDLQEQETKPLKSGM